jgi:phage terminase small subunit
MKIPTAPKNLTPGALAAWRDIHRRYRVHQDCLPALTELVEALSRKEQAQEAIAADGILIEDRFKVKRPHPALAIERDSRLAVLRCLKVLGLPSVEESRLGRPPLKDNR